MVVERHEFRHGSRHGSEAEVDFAMKWKADDWRYAAGIIGKQSIREFGAAAHQSADRGATVATPEQRAGHEEGSNHQVIDHSMSFGRDEFWSATGYCVGSSGRKRHDRSSREFCNQRRVKMPFSTAATDAITRRAPKFISPKAH